MDYQDLRDESANGSAQNAKDLPLGRSENPQLWDLELEYERRRADQLAEVGHKTARMVALMARVEELEPLVQRVAEREREVIVLRNALAALESAHQTLAESHKALSDSCHAYEAAREGAHAEALAQKAEIERQSAAAGQLRDYAANLEGQLVLRQREGEQAAASAQRKHNELADQVGSLERQLEESRASRADAEMVASAHIEALMSEVEDRNRSLDAARARAEAAQAGLEECRNHLAERESALADRTQCLQHKEDEARHLRADLGRSNEALEQRAFELQGKDAESRSLRAELERSSVALARFAHEQQAQDEHTRRVQNELDHAQDVRAQHAREQQVKDDEAGRVRAELAQAKAALEQRANEYQAKAAEAHALRTELDRLNEAVSSIRGEKSRVEAAWQHAVDAQRADRDLHDNYLSATLAALTEIRPMISALEARLQSKDQTPANGSNDAAASVPPALPSAAPAVPTDGRPFFTQN